MKFNTKNNQRGFIPHLSGNCLHHNRSLCGVCQKGAGFTAVEILMVIAIISLLAGMGLFISMDFYRSYSFRSDRDMTVSILERARAKSLANINSSAHGVYFDSGSSEFVLFQGDSYSDPGRDTSLDQEISLNSGIAVTGINEVVFEQLTGNASIAGDMVLSYGVQSAVITFNEEGRI